MNNRLKIKSAILALLLLLGTHEPTNAAISDAQLPYSADPYQKWEGWQDAGAATVLTPELRDGNVYNLTSAQIIYYAALENKLNPLLLLVKLQAEQSLIVHAYQQPELARRLERAVGYGFTDSNPSQSKWSGFYPQLVGMSYEFATMKTKSNFHDAFMEYTPYESKYTELVTMYAQYAAKMNTIAGKTYATTPTSSGYLEDFQDITAAQIQQFLNAFTGNLKNAALFPHDAQAVPVVKAKIVTMPVVPAQITQNDTIAFKVATDKSATKVTMVFTNPDAEIALSGSGKSWSFSKLIEVANNRTWLLRVYSGTQITDERFGGNINVIGNTPASSLAAWQQENVDYANSQNQLYATTPLTDVYGRTCGTYSYCARWSKYAPNSFDVSGDAKDAFARLLTKKTAVEDTNFAHAPIGSIVFYNNGKYGHAAIKVDETHIVSQGQLSTETYVDCTISNVDWNHISNYAGYYAPAPGTTLIDNNIIPKAEQVTRGQFLTALAAVLETASPDLPDVPMEKATLMGLVTDPLNFNPNAPILRQDAARMMARAIAYFETNKRWFFAKTGNSNQFAKDAVTKADAALYPTAVRMAELGLFAGVLQEDGSYTFEGLRQLSKTEKGLLLDKRLPALFAKASAIPTTGYSKIANDGSLLADTAVLGTGAKAWACTRDNGTGLVWEVKTDDGGLRDKDNTYSWYDPNPATNGDFAGYQSNGDTSPYLGGICTGGILCNTDAYKNAVNTKKLCGYGDWRVPSFNDLWGLNVTTGYFPDTNQYLSPSWWSWSSETDYYDSGDAWSISGYPTDGFSFSHSDDSFPKDSGIEVRLVRSGQ
ncbi:MAG: DUF1566 domain-containing protein [Methylovulum sp.]|nr:DUF1566 domain-containing protein [Methylovulum sp.]MCF8000205.1 DUF1566 domain-containing protein [Methylovulum sp.]